MTDAVESISARRIRCFAWVLCIMLGFMQAWASRMTLVNDTVSYLDMGDHIWRGQWSMAITGVWNPFYAAILGITIGIFRPSLYWEYPLVHLVLFLIFVVTLWSFDFLLRESIRLRRQNEMDGELSPPTWVWLAIGYTVFLWSSLRLIGVSETNPDMLVAACFYCACGLLVRARSGVARWPAYLALGLVLGLGYLTKQIMFPISVVCLAIAFILGARRRQWVQASGCLLVFLAVSGPFAAALSVSRGRVTFGESGTFNYITHVNLVQPVHWQAGIPGSGKPLHPTRQIFDRPATFAFSGPLEATYPVWYDPSYWLDGVKVRFKAGEQARVTARHLLGEAGLSFDLHGSLIGCLFVMLWVSVGKWSALKELSTYSFLLIPAAAGLISYTLIYWEPRYLAPFAATLVLSLFLSVRLPPSPAAGRLCTAVAIFLFAMFICPFQSPSLNLRTVAHDLVGRSKFDPNSYQQVAIEMNRLGLQPGDPIASLEFSNLGAAMWAHLARVRIVAEVYSWPGCSGSEDTCPSQRENDFWEADPATQGSVIQALAKTGARLIVSQETPRGEGASGWLRAGHTQYYVYRLQAPTYADVNQSKHSH